MKQKIFLFLVLAMAWVAFNATSAWAQETPEKSTKEKSTKEKSIGGTQSERAGEQQTPVPGSPGASGPRAGTSPSEKEGKMPGERAGRAERKGAEGMEARGARGGERWDKEQVKVAQEALKNKGHDPGPIDGVVGPRTREAIKQFQSASGLKETGRLDTETAQKLGVDKGATPKEARETKEPAAKEPATKGKAESSPIPREPPAKGQPESSPMPTEPSPMGK